ncbi:MAG: zinc ribbon domain-containing protein [Clostridia bacterium]|nr:zinc ribbon domain-containing protein [Clostridia bacterium]
MNINAAPAAIALTAVLTVSLTIGFCVYRDAKRRGMNAGLWALIAAVAPALIGLIAYYVAGQNHPDLRCPNCDAPVQEQSSVCPKCGQTLNGVQKGVRSPVRKKDTSIPRFFAIIFLTLILIGMVVLPILSAVSGSGGEAIYRETAIDTYFASMEQTPAQAAAAEKVRTWLDSLEPEMHHAYALQYDSHTEAGNEHYFLICVPGAAERSLSGFSQSDGLFGSKLSLILRSTGKGDALFTVMSPAKRVSHLEIILDDRQIPCEISAVDFNPT